MFARLFLALIVLGAAPMAMAQPACHEATAAMPGTAHHQMPAKNALPAGGMCIGCVAPVTVQPPVLPARIALPAAPARPARLATKSAGMSLPPAIPPPRLG